MNAHNISHPQKILFIEDDDGLTRLIPVVLERGGYEAVIAKTGEQGITLARQELPDLILCDIMMPEMSGLDVLRALQNQSDTATIPFIFLTARSRPEDVRAGMELGADDYLTKPVQTNVLLSAINSRLKRHQALQADRLAVFAQRLVLSQEYQRQQMAHVLDNEVNQSLRSLQFIFNLLDAPNVQDVSLYDETKEMLGNLIQRVEELAQELHPTMLGRLGLVPAVRWLTEQYELAIELETENLDYKFEPELGVCIFRLVQESLDNIARHAHTSKAKITLKYAAPFVEVRVEDHGIGFDLEQTLQSTQSMGLQHMYGLVAWLNGELHITSGLNEGTVIYALLPQTRVVPALRPSVSRDFLRLSSRFGQAEKGNSSDTTVRILLAMEQPLQLRGMYRLLTDKAQFQVVGEVQDLAQTVEALEKYQPHLLIINPVSADKSQPELLQTIMAAYPETAVLVISTTTHDEYVRAAFENGALGYIPNIATITDLHTAIMRVAKKQHYLSPTLTFDLARWQGLKTT